MPTPIPVCRGFVVPALLEIENDAFARWYSHGVFWAMYGDYQGNGPYEDRYLIDNVARNLAMGRYNRPDASELPCSGFYVGMVHGGNVNPKTHAVDLSSALVNVTDADFSEGYQQGRQHPYPLTDSIFMQQLRQFAVQHIVGPALAYELGLMVGTLSHALKLASMPMTSRSGMVYIP